MIAIGKFNVLTVCEELAEGLLLTDRTDTVLLPRKAVSPEMQLGAEVNVFVYKDNETRLVATTQVPNAVVGEFAYMEVKAVNTAGAFLDWGLEKDILVPFREQTIAMQEGNWYVVYVYLDVVSSRVTASARLSKFLQQADDTLKENDAVDILITKRTNLGFDAIINNAYRGLLYENEIFEIVNVGEKRKAYIKKIRDDFKIDLKLQARDFGISDDAKEKIIAALQNNNGFLPLNDNSEPDAIRDQLQMSKKSFKKAVGGLFKEKKIILRPDGIEWVP
ncbi:MAG: RNA-binding protein [Chitinophagales bacterium]|nr:RNA-binding protein [Chitinophagales bacterium]